MKRITTKAWFGKRILGWGYRPVSLEGWLVTIVFLIAIIVNMSYNGKTTIGYAILVVILLIFFIIARLTGDTPGSETWDKIRSKN